MGRSFLLPLLGLLAFGYAAKCPNQRTSPGREILCYTSSNDIKNLEDSICRCTTLVHQGHDLRDLSSSDIKDLRKSLKELNPALQFVVSVNDDDGSLKNSARIRLEAAARIVRILDEVDGVELNVTAGTKERLVHFVEGLKTEMVRKSKEKRIFLVLPTKPQELAKQFDLKTLTKYVDLFTIPTHYLVDDEEAFRTFHPSRLMGLFDMLNADSLVDLVTGLGADKQKILISMPASAYKFTLVNDKENAPRAATKEKQPTQIRREEMCEAMETGEWIIERDEDLTAPYAFKDDTWIAFEDKISAGIKGKYVLLRDLAGMGIHDVDRDSSSKCGKSLAEEIYHSFMDNKRKSREAVLTSLQEDLQQQEIDYPEHVKSSDFRISRVVDSEGHIHANRENTQMEFSCPRQGYFVHPKSCNRFYRCVKFNQEVEDYTIFEFDCPAGLAFDERVEVCVWPGSMSEGSACPGSSEIGPSKGPRFSCPDHPGYYADPQNCRFFYACYDLGGHEMMAYEFRCPYGLVFDEEKMVCEWPYLVPRCGGGTYHSTGGGGYDTHGAGQGGYDHGQGGYDGGHGGHDGGHGEQEGGHGGYDGGHGGHDGGHGEGGNGGYDGGQGGHNGHDGHGGDSGHGGYDGGHGGSDGRHGGQGGHSGGHGISGGGHGISGDGHSVSGGGHGISDGGHGISGGEHGISGGGHGIYGGGHDGSSGGHGISSGGHGTSDGGYDVSGGGHGISDGGHGISGGGHGISGGGHGIYGGGHDVSSGSHGTSDGGHHVSGGGHGTSGGGHDVSGSGHGIYEGGHSISGSGHDASGGGHGIIDGGHGISGGGHDASGGGHDVSGGGHGIYEGGHGSSGGGHGLYEGGHGISSGGHGISNGGHDVSGGGHDVSGGGHGIIGGGHGISDGKHDVSGGGHGISGGGHDVSGGGHGIYEGGHGISGGGHDVSGGGHDISGGGHDVSGGGHGIYEGGHGISDGGHDVTGGGHGISGGEHGGSDSGHEVSITGHGGYDDGYENKHTTNSGYGHNEHTTVHSGHGGYTTGYGDAGHSTVHSNHGDSGYTTGHSGYGDNGHSTANSGHSDSGYTTGHSVHGGGEHSTVYSGHGDGGHSTVYSGHGDGGHSTVYSGHGDGGHSTVYSGHGDGGHSTAYSGHGDGGHSTVYSGHGDGEHTTVHSGHDTNGHTIHSGYGGDEHSTIHAGSNSGHVHGGSTSGGHDYGHTTVQTGHGIGHTTVHSEHGDNGYTTVNSGHGDNGGYSTIHSGHSDGGHSTINSGYGEYEHSTPHTIVENNGGHTPIYTDHGSDGHSTAHSGYTGHGHGIVHTETDQNVHTTVHSGSGGSHEVSIGGGYGDSSHAVHGGSTIYEPINGEYTTPAYVDHAGHSKAPGINIFTGSGHYDSSTPSSVTDSGEYHGNHRNTEYTTLNTGVYTGITSGIFDGHTPIIQYEGPAETGESHGIHGGSVGTADSSSGSLYTHGGASGTVHTGTNQQGKIISGGSQQGYVQNHVGAPGYVVTNGVKKTYDDYNSKGTFAHGAGDGGVVITGPQIPGVILGGQSGPGTYLNGPTAPGVNLGGGEISINHSGGNKYSSSGSGTSVYKGNALIPTGHQISTGGQRRPPTVNPNNPFLNGAIQNGYKTNEYHDNGGRGTIRYNNGEITHKYTEEDVKNHQSQFGTLPKFDVSTYNQSPGAFTKTGPTKTGITTAQLGGSASYVAGAVTPRPPPNAQNIGANAFASSHAEANSGSYGSSNSGNIRTSQVNGNSDNVKPSSGYSYSKPTAGSAKAPIASIEQKNSPYQSNPDPFLNIHVYNNNPFLNGGVMKPSASINGRIHQNTPPSSSGGSIGSRPIVSNDRKPFPGLSTSTGSPIAFTTGPLENYRTTVFDAARIPSGVSTVHPVYDTGYKTVVSSTQYPINGNNYAYSQNTDHRTDSQSVKGDSALDINVSHRPNLPSQGYYDYHDAIVPATVPEYSGFDHQQAHYGAGESNYESGKNNYEQSGGSYGQKIPQGSAKPPAIYQSPIVTSSDQIYNVPTSTIAPAIGVTYRQPFKVITSRPTVAPSSGYNYSKPPVGFSGTTASPIQIPYKNDIPQAYDSPKQRVGSPSNLDIPRTGVEKIGSNNNRGSTKFATSGYNINIHNDGDEAKSNSGGYVEKTDRTSDYRSNNNNRQFGNRVEIEGPNGYENTNGNSGSPSKIGSVPSTTYSPLYRTSPTRRPVSPTRRPESYSVTSPAITTYSGRLSSTSSYDSTTPTTLGKPKGRGKVIVKFSDLHPLLLGKLGAECTCKADPFANFRDGKPLPINSSKGRVDLRNYDESDIYVDLESSQEDGDYDSSKYVAGNSPKSDLGITGEKYQAKDTAALEKSSFIRPQISSATYSSPAGSTKSPTSTYLPPGGSSRANARISSGDASIGVSFANGGRAGNFRAGKNLAGFSQSSSNALASAGFQPYDPADLKGNDVIVQETTDCVRPGLFRHPSRCNKFYACHWDEWKKKYTLHIFNCPVHLTFDSAASACNWPSKGPACQDDNLLV